ncbi:lytic transglycosylase [Rodentibacter sp. JRC1]|uniref:lytic transglycosylase domain-containing protein n=1 Tax=Rodentibacter sp. JRC1 TaxID=2874504 RepID=UPI001CFD2E7F|nr:lytic transglycosylase domain-containing protein [Rodentibacter sp. JRC1]GJI56950.1 lytic transglycosylase [Rodentibacter sp. JRC1]
MMKLIKYTLFLLFPLYSQANCFEKVGRYYNFDPDYLRAIAWKESQYNVNAIGKNNDGSRDIGIMQINTSNIEKLKPIFPAISVKNLIKYPCFNVSVGGYILNENFKKYGRKWIAIGVYNAGSKNNDKRVKIRYNYAKDVNLYYNKIKRKELRLPRI